MAQIKTTQDLMQLSQKYLRAINEAKKMSPVLQHLTQEEQDSGKNVVIQTSLGISAESFKDISQEITASSYEEGADCEDDEKTDVKAPIDGLLPWARYRSMSYVSGQDQAASGSNEKLFVNNLCKMANALVAFINKHFYTGSEGATIIGFDQAIGDDKNTYAGIDRSDPENVAWRPSVFYKFGPETALSFFQIKGDLQEIASKSKESPDLAFVHPNTLSKIKSLWDPKKLPETIEIDGCKFIGDYDAPVGRIYYLNSKYVSIKILKVRNAMALSLKQMTKLGLIENDDKLILGMHPEMLAKLGDSDKIMLKTYPQLVVERPNTCGVRFNIV